MTLCWNRGIDELKKGASSTFVRFPSPASRSGDVALLFSLLLYRISFLSLNQAKFLPRFKSEEPRL